MDTNPLDRAPDLEALVLRVLGETLHVKTACDAAGISTATLTAWRKRLPDFDTACYDALSVGRIRLEDEAVRRAVDGWMEPVFYKGDVAGYVRKFSDPLLQTLLKGHFPEKYKDRVEHSGGIDIAAQVLEARGRTGGG